MDMDYKVVAANVSGYEIGATVTRDELEEAGVNVDALVRSGHVAPVGETVNVNPTGFVGATNNNEGDDD